MRPPQASCGKARLRPAPALCVSTDVMALPAKLQASILSWVGESSAVPSQPVATEDGETYPYPLLTPADLFSLSSEGLAAGSPGVVVKDGFLGREEASRAHEGEISLLSGSRTKPVCGMLCVAGQTHMSGELALFLTPVVRNGTRCVFL